MKKLILLLLISIGVASYSQTNDQYKLGKTFSQVYSELKDDSVPDSDMEIIKDRSISFYKLPSLISYTFGPDGTCQEYKLIADSRLVLMFVESLDRMSVTHNRNNWIIHKNDQLVFVNMTTLDELIYVSFRLIDLDKPSEFID